LFCIGVKRGLVEGTLIAVFEDMELRGIVGPMTEEGGGKWRKLHNQELRRIDLLLWRSSEEWCDGKFIWTWMGG